MQPSWYSLQPADYFFVLEMNSHLRLCSDLCSIMYYLQIIYYLAPLYVYAL